MAASRVAHPCGCGVEHDESGRATAVKVCNDHSAFDGVRRAFRILGGALEEAHEKLPCTPEPPRAA